MKSFVRKLNDCRTYGKARSLLAEKGYKEIGNSRVVAYEPQRADNKPRFEKFEQYYLAHYCSEKHNTKSHYVVIFGKGD